MNFTFLSLYKATFQAVIRTFFYSITKMTVVLTGSFAQGQTINVAQLVEHRVIMREAVSSTAAGPTLRVLKITEQKVLPL